jgi:CheY-like chemotaxis protein
MTATATKKRVLVVDDNQDAARTLGFLLAAEGFEVQTCLDGRTALLLAPHFRPDACILDISMPGMNGYELARRLREALPDHPPVLATVTAYGDFNHLDRAADAGFDLHFTKPADHAEIAEQLEECVRRVTEAVSVGAAEALSCSGA